MTLGLPLRDLKHRFVVRLALQAQAHGGDTDMVKLSTVQLDRLRFLGYSERGALGGTRKATIAKLMTLGFIRDNGRLFRSYEITPEGIDHLLSVVPNAPIHTSHMGPVVIGAYVIHNGRTGVVRKMHVTENNTIFGGVVGVEFDDSVIKCEMISFRELETTAARSAVHFREGREGHGDSRSWTRLLNGKLYSFNVVNMPNGEVRWFVSIYNGYIGGPKFACAWSRVRQWTFTAVQPVPTKWVAERNGLNLWRDEDKAMAYQSTPVFDTRFGALGALTAMLTDEISGWKRMGKDATRDELILSDVIGHPNRNEWSAGNVQWSIRGW